MADGPDPRVSRTVLILLVALLIGLAAAFLLQSPSGSSGVQLFPNTTPPTLPSWVGPALILAFVGGMFGVLVLRRATGPGSTNVLLPVAFVGLLVGIVLYVIFRLLRTSSGGTASGAAHPMKPTGGPPPSVGGLPGGAVSSPPSGEAYLIFAALIAAGVAAAFLVPRWAEYRRDRSETLAGPRTAPPIAELEAALARLRSAGPTDDPRNRIIRAYGGLLDRVARGLPSVGSSTPREIELECVRVYHLTPRTAHELTRLFEEARYSRGRPMGAPDVDRAEEALRKALGEIGAGARPGP